MIDWSPARCAHDAKRYFSSSWTPQPWHSLADVVQQTTPQRQKKKRKQTTTRRTGTNSEPSLHMFTKNSSTESARTYFRTLPPPWNTIRNPFWLCAHLFIKYRHPKTAFGAPCLKMPSAAIRRRPVVPHTRRNRVRRPLHVRFIGTYKRWF